jgi:23S rRNA pseudouridine1911/1915/1917 synthase
MNEIQVQLEILEAPTRLDLALLQHLQKTGTVISRAKLKDWFHDKKILLKGYPAPGSLTLHPGTYEVTLVDCETSPQQAVAASIDFNLPIVYEDENLLILHKRSGTPSLPHSAEEKNTAVNFALALHPNMATFGKSPLEAGLIHRLDTGTSGLLVFAKTKEEFDRVSLAWKNREIRKFYRAWVSPISELPSFLSVPSLPHLIQYPLAHDGKSAKKMIAIQDTSPQKMKRLNIRGKPLEARTWIRADHSLSQKNKITNTMANNRDLEIEIETGVMHQIRCHLASIECPIIGDPQYKGKPSERLWLHAWRLELTLKSGVKLRLEAALPEGWHQVSHIL